MGLDVGDKTIGVAVSDMLRITAGGVLTINRIGQRKDTSTVMEMVREYQCTEVVIGLPLRLDGGDSIQTAKVRDFARNLENKFRSNGLADIKVVLHDERFTTKIAQNVLIEADVSRTKRKSVIDKQAAVIILQSYLEGLRLT